MIQLFKSGSESATMAVLYSAGVRSDNRFHRTQVVTVRSSGAAHSPNLSFQCVYVIALFAGRYKKTLFEIDLIEIVLNITRKRKKDKKSI